MQNKVVMLWIVLFNQNASPESHSFAWNGLTNSLLQNDQKNTSSHLAVTFKFEALSSTQSETPNIAKTADDFSEHLRHLTGAPAVGPIPWTSSALEERTNTVNNVCI